MREREEKKTCRGPHEKINFCRTAGISTTEGQCESCLLLGIAGSRREDPSEPTAAFARRGFA